MTEKLKRCVMTVALVLFVTLPAVGDEQSSNGGCVLQSIELDDQDSEPLLRIRTDGEPASIGARVDPAAGVVLDLGCVPGPDLSGQEFAEGLVSALQLNHGSTEQGGPTALVIKIRDAFEYSVSTQPDTVLVSLRAKDSAALDGRQPDIVAERQPDIAPTAEPSGKIRVLEPLPIPAAPRPPLPPPPAPQAAPPPPTPDDSQIVAAISDWARAWADQRVDDYLAAYASGFRPPDGLDRRAWEAQRQSRVTAPAWIEVTLDDIEVYVIGTGQAIAVFRQSYGSNTFSDEVDKTLTLIDEGGRWRILREEAGRLNEANAPFPAPAATAETMSSDDLPAIEAPTAAPTATTLVEGARNSVLIAPTYDASYRFIPYPGGDPGWERGSAADVLIRAYRHAGVDLQERVHEDILAANADYGIETPDPHIDHRRLRNLRIFLSRHGRELAIDPDADWRPGDIVFWATDGKRRPDHLGIVSDRRSSGGGLLVIHHEEGRIPTEEDALSAWTVRGHYRWLPAAGGHGQP